MKNSIDMVSVSPIKTPSEATVKVPGSKSYSLRALFISALCQKEFKVKNLLESDDTRAMQECLKSLKTKRIDLEAGESGVTARFMITLACISEGAQKITGEPGLLNRPVKDLVDALRQLGAQIEYMDKDGFLPLKVLSSNLEGGTVRLKGSTSSQYLSALLLIAPKLENGLFIEVEGRQISKPYIDATIDIMEYFGIKVTNTDYQKYEVKPQKYRPKDYEVEGDYSSAAYFFAINALTGSNIEILGLNTSSKQGDRRFADLLSSDLPTAINAEDFPDQAMTLAVMAAFIPRKTVINGVKSLRVKETERVKAVENELAKMGIKTESSEDSLIIYGGSPKPAIIDTYGDHRIAMSFAVAAIKTEGIKILNPSVVNKTFPGFWDELTKITEVKQGKKEFSNILLIGMRGSGKTTAGKILAKKLDKKFIDMDVLIESKQGKKVRDIVLDSGWEYFRQLEAEACKELSSLENTVISSGGGIVLDQSNMDLFKENSVTILLRANPTVLSSRIRTDKNRPELSTQPTLLGELGQVWEKRKEMYYKNADFIIDTSEGSPQDITDGMIEKLTAGQKYTCMVIGDPVEHSLSPDIHNLGYKKLGLDSKFEYTVKRVKTDVLADFISRIKQENIYGISLTMPHKELVMPLLDEIFPTAKEIGAVNTIVNKHGHLTGYNTDYLGAIKPLQKITALKGKKVAVLGAGGAAKAFVYGLTHEGADVTIYNRTEAKAKELADKFNCRHSRLDAIDEIKQADIICNTTSVGMDEDKSPIDSSLIYSGQIVFDAVYSPLETTLLKTAKAKGAKTISGVEMLLEQAFAQFALFTGQEAPEKYIRDIILKKLNHAK